MTTSSPARQTSPWGSENERESLDENTHDLHDETWEVCLLCLLHNLGLTARQCRSLDMRHPKVFFGRSTRAIRYTHKSGKERTRVHIFPGDFWLLFGGINIGLRVRLEIACVLLLRLLDLRYLMIYIPDLNKWSVRMKNLRVFKMRCGWWSFGGWHFALTCHTGQQDDFLLSTVWLVVWVLAWWLCDLLIVL